jgi:hypothetical protein
MKSQPGHCGRVRLRRIDEEEGCYWPAISFIFSRPSLIAPSTSPSKIALQHVDPRTRVRVHHVGEMKDPGHVTDAERFGGHDDARIGGEIFVVGERRPRRQNVVLGEPFELGLVGQLPSDELPG